MLGNNGTGGTERDQNAGLRRFAIYAIADDQAVCMGVGCTVADQYAVDLKDEPASPLVYDSESKLRGAIKQHVNSESEPRVWFSFEDSFGLRIPDERFNGITLSRHSSQV